MRRDKLFDKEKIAADLDTFDAPISDNTVLRLCRKIYAGAEVYDLRLWQRDLKGRLYPRRGQGLCLRGAFWELALKLFSDHGLPLKRPINYQVTSQDDSTVDDAA